MHFLKKPGVEISIEAERVHGGKIDTTYTCIDNKSKKTPLEGGGKHDTIKCVYRAP